MKYFFYGIVTSSLLFIVGLFLWNQFEKQAVLITPGGQLIPRPLDAYAIEALRSRSFPDSSIILDDAIATTSAYTVYHFHFLADSKKVTGLAHVPNGTKPASGFPVIVQFRGYVDRDIYDPGIGTKRSSEVFATNGFLTLAPDFLGYGGSDNPSPDVFEERFQTYTTGATLLSSIETFALADPARVGIWAHSNGGQIALTVLEILGQDVPTTLWAPVTKPFPYSILYYTDEASDSGKLLRQKLARFEQTYDTDRYSLVHYLDFIQAPLQLHQGLSDDAVPQMWSDDFVKLLREKEKDVSYFVYPGSDHNMKGGWDTVVSRDIEFFRSQLRKQE